VCAWQAWWTNVYCNHGQRRKCGLTEKCHSTEETWPSHSRSHPSARQCETPHSSSNSQPYYHLQLGAPGPRPLQSRPGAQRLPLRPYFEEGTRRVKQPYGHLSIPRTETFNNRDSSILWSDVTNASMSVGTMLKNSQLMPHSAHISVYLVHAVSCRWQISAGNGSDAHFRGLEQSRKFQNFLGDCAFSLRRSLYFLPFSPLPSSSTVDCRVAVSRVWALSPRSSSSWSYHRLNSVSWVNAAKFSFWPTSSARGDEPSLGVVDRNNTLARF
jgi:hypothetical protein